jgi:hypothetical protein
VTHPRHAPGRACGRSISASRCGSADRSYCRLSTATTGARDRPAGAHRSAAKAATLLAHALAVTPDRHPATALLWRDTPASAKAAAEPMPPPVAPSLAVERPCPSPLPQPERSRRKRAGQHGFSRRRPRAHHYRQTPVVGSWKRPSSTEAGSRLLRGPVADCERNRDRAPDEATARTVCLACSSTRRAAGSSFEG